MRFILTFFILINSFLHAQVLAPSLQTSPNDIPNFNFPEIKKLKIKTIVFDLVDKKDFQVAEDKDLSRHYEFDTAGRLVRSYYTVISRIIQKEVHAAPVYRKKRLISGGEVSFKNVYEFDTLSGIFLYDSKNNLTCKRLRDGNFYSTTYYWYDSINRPSRILSCKETNVSADKSVFVLGTQQVLFDERYKYINPLPTQYKKLCLNDENRVYKEVITDLNKNNQVIQLNESFITTWINQRTNFVYNEKNQLTEKRYTSNAGTAIELKETYEYKNGILDTEKHYKNNVLLSETGYVYDPGTNVLNSYVTRDPLSKSLQIVKLIYTYY
ncbi:MAG: hypothetical protein ACXVPN_05550 [Bacteroidia bacterium]